MCAKKINTNTIDKYLVRPINKQDKIKLISATILYVLKRKKGHHVQLHYNKFENLGEIHKLLKEKMKNLNLALCVKEIQSVVNNNIKEIPGPKELTK